MIPLFVDLETEWRGGQSQALLLLKGLYERGHAAELIAVKGSPLGHQARRAGIYVHSLRPNLTRLRAASKIRSILADGRVDLVHVNEPHALTAAWLAGAHRRVPLLVSRRVANPIKKGPLSLGRYLAAKRILAITQFVKKSVLDSGVPAECVEVLYEGVQVPTLPTPEVRRRARERWRVTEHEILFGCVGYLLPEKGQEFVVRALPAVREIFPAARLLLAGDGPCRSQLEALARELGVEGAIIFAGFVDDVSQVYAALNAFVFPSLAEPLGTSLLAAMAWGLPSVAVASGGVPEYVVHNDNGLLVGRPDHTLFSGEMLRLLSDPTLAKRLGVAARATIEDRFSADRMVENTLNLYQQVI
jgi:glycosyltransferase involved in cell wall biosynthesis